MRCIFCNTKQITGTATVILQSPNKKVGILLFTVNPKDFEAYKQEKDILVKQNWTETIIHNECLRKLC